MLQSHPLMDLPHAGFDDDELCLNGRPPDWCNPRPREPYHLLVIGAGPAGLVAARAAVRSVPALRSSRNTCWVVSR